MADVEDEPMLDTLMSLGATEATSRGRISAMRSARAAATVAEVYGGGAIVDCANKARRDLNLKGLRTRDLRTLRPDGRPWGFTVRADRILAREILDQDDPDWLIASPPCTALSLWMYAMNY